MKELTWILVCFFIAMPIIAASNFPNMTQIIVQTDSTLEMKCQLMTEDDYRNVTWQRGNVLLAIGPLLITTDPRIEVDEQNLRIRSVTSTDSGIYVCQLGVAVTEEDKQQIAVLVEDSEISCYPLTPIDNGQIFYEPEVADNQQGVANGTVVYYECDEGFRLVGKNHSTCSVELHEWDAVQPYCVNETIYSESLTPAIVSRNRLKSLNRRMETLLKEQRAMQDHLDDQVRDLRSHLSSVRNASLSSANALESVVEQFLNRSVARTRPFKDTEVHEFIWHVRNLESEVAKNKTGVHLLSHRFYSTIPGYRLQLRLYPNDKPGHIGLYAGFVPGAFDDELTWPFTGRYQLAIVGRKENVSDVAYLYTVPSEQGCHENSFIRPIDGHPEACGFGDMMSHKKLFRRPQDFLDKEGRLAIRFRLY